MNRHIGKIAGAVAAAAVLVAAAGAAAGPVTFEWDWPTNMVGGVALPAELQPELRGTLLCQRFGTTNWIESGTTQTSTNRITVDVPVGAWLCAVTAQFGTNVATRSDRSSNLTYRAYGRLMAVGNLRLLVVSE